MNTQGVPIGGSIMFLGGLANPPIDVPANFRTNDGRDFTAELRSPLTWDETDNANGLEMPYKNDYTFDSTATIEDHEVKIRYSDLPYNLTHSDISMGGTTITAAEFDFLCSIDDSNKFVMGGTEYYKKSVTSKGMSATYGYIMAWHTDKTPTNVLRNDMTNGDRIAPRSKTLWSMSGNALNGMNHVHAAKDHSHVHYISSLKMSLAYTAKSVFMNTHPLDESTPLVGDRKQLNIKYTLRPKSLKAVMITRIW